jgi:hypothetical protein
MNPLAVLLSFPFALSTRFRAFGSCTIGEVMQNHPGATTQKWKNVKETSSLHRESLYRCAPWTARLFTDLQQALSGRFRALKCQKDVEYE